MSKSKTKKEEVKNKLTYSEFCIKESTRTVNIDENYYFNGEVGSMYSQNIGKDYFNTRKRSFSLFRPDVPYKLEFLDYIYKHGLLLHRDIEARCEYTFRLPDGDTIVNLNIDTHSYEQDKLDVLFLYANDSSVNFKRFEEYSFVKVKSHKLGIFKRVYQEIAVHDVLLNDVKPFDPLNYNEDFEPFLNTITQELGKKDSGLFLFHGEPGTGKSSFIRSLTGIVDRQFIFVPPHLFREVFSIDMLDLFLDKHQGAVLVIEDAEKLLLKRDSEDGFSSSETVAAILNITDGLYADLTKLAIIATYNCDRSLIDPAILRKGRLKLEYEFKKLKADRVKQLSEKYNLNIETFEEMTIADAYNYSQEKSKCDKPTRKIGFCA